MKQSTQFKVMMIALSIGGFLTLVKAFMISPMACVCFVVAEISSAFAIFFWSRKNYWKRREGNRDFLTSLKEALHSKRNTDAQN